MSKRAIPPVPATADPAMARTLQAIKEDLEIIIGHRGGRVEKLGASATTDQIIAKINELIDRIQ